jgi:hypothetical protein
MIAAALLVTPMSAALADGPVRGKTHHRHFYVAPAPLPPPAAFGGRLVSHPAWNIACNKRDAGTRALPCDQPVWVYGTPCEIGLGGGRYVNCD